MEEEKEIIEAHDLTDKEIKLLSDYRRSMQDLQARLQGAMHAILSLRDLEGNWDFGETKITKR